MKYSPKNFRPQASASLSDVRQPVLGPAASALIHRLNTEWKIKALNTKLLSSRHINNKKASFPVDVVLKTLLLKLPYAGFHHMKTFKKL